MWACESLAMRGNMSVATKAKRIKLVFGIVIPVLVLVTTIVMVSMSFAWFSQETTASIQSINLATQKAFMLEFGSSGVASDNLPYRGQKAIDKNQQLVSPYTSTEETYTIDAPYFFISAIQIGTGGQEVTLQLALDGVEISKGDTVIDTYIRGKQSLSPPHDASDIPLAFTWFFKDHQDQSSIFTPTPNYSGSRDDNKMKFILPQSNDIWYTPYGKMEFSADSKLAKINGEDYTISSKDKFQNRVNIEQFSAEEGEYFDFYIIFAPEKLFWSHIFTENYSEKVTDIYPSEEEQKKIYGEKFFEAGKLDQTKYGMYYSEQETYQGSTFKFGAVLNVLEISSVEEQDSSVTP